MKRRSLKALDNIPQAFLGLFEGTNLGKQLVKIAEPAVKYSLL
jgi:NADPH-dependent curcumin reductase CurA